MSTFINVAGVVLIGFIIWWFWLSRPKAARASPDRPIDVLVANGVYEPATIEVSAGRPAILRFLRKDPSPCAEQVRFDDLGVTAELPVGEPLELTVVPPRPGEYPFTCQMQMYRGMLIAR